MPVFYFAWEKCWYVRENTRQDSQMLSTADINIPSLSVLKIVIIKYEQTRYPDLLWCW